MATELSPCPFCGHDTARHMTGYDVAVMQDRRDASTANGHYVICDAVKGGCGALSGFSSYKNEAYSRWNTRRFQ